MNLSAIRGMNVGEIGDAVCRKIVSFGAKVHLSSMVSLLICAAVVVIFGCIAVRLLKPMASVGSALVGFLAGYAGFSVLITKIAFFAKLPGWSNYVLAGILAAGLLVLGWKFDTYAICVAFGFGAFFLVRHFADNSIYLSVAAAFLMAFLTILLLKYAVIFVCSGLAGVATVLLVSGAFPKFAPIQSVLYGNKSAVVASVSVALLFVLIQLLTTAKKTFARK